MIKTSHCFVAVAVLGLLTSWSVSAFIGSHPASTTRRSSPLHATYAFQRALLAERLGAKNPDLPPSPPAPLPTAAEGVTTTSGGRRRRDNEKFQRALLEAKLAYDATADATAEAAPLVADPEPVAVSIAAPKPMAAVAAAAAAAAAVPEPKLEPVAAPGPTAVVRSTEFTVPRELAIVPINEASVQFAAGALGGVVGLVLGGPILGAVAASAFNYISRKEDDRSSSSSSLTTRETVTAKRVVDTASQTALLAYNFIAQFERDNKVVDSVLRFLESAVDGLKGTDSPGVDALVALESTLGGIANKVEEWNDDYDLLGGAGTVLDSVGDLVEIGVDKVVELNGEYKLTDRAIGVIKVAVERVTEK
ncbi:hypothetical protein ACHAW5_009401 [Stephanodiscus triporus]|uniref:Uncharacterized protein n=1 Tax=Stephanodiscus triporus TaxID=2934178 RepID=A0ABD3PKN1_9STRA